MALGDAKFVPKGILKFSKYGCLILLLFGFCIGSNWFVSDTNDSLKLAIVGFNSRRQVCAKENIKIYIYGNLILFYLDFISEAIVFFSDTKNYLKLAIVGFTQSYLSVEGSGV